MAIEIETIRKVAHLARLELTEQEEQELSVDIEQILDWINQLDEVDTQNVEPMVHIHDNVNAMRKDEPHNDLSREQGLFNAPEKEGNFFKVVKVL